MVTGAQSQRIFGVLGVILSLSLAWPTLAEPLSSTYIPTLTVAIDGIGADRSVVLRSHRDNPAQDDIYLCGRGLCAFHDNQHADEWSWSYTVEQLKSKAPAKAVEDPTLLQTWYNDHSADTVVTFNVTTALHQASFTKTPRKRDYTLQLTSADHGVELVTVDAGEYNPLPQEFSLSNLSFPIADAKKHAVEIGSVVITILIIYYGIKIVTI